MLVSTTSDRIAWVVDSGATHHMCNDCEAFRKNSLRPAQAAVRLGDKSVLQVTQQGTVVVNGVRLTALFIPEFWVSLLSVAQLDASGLETTFGNGVCTVSDGGGRPVIQARQAHGLYWVDSPGSPLAARCVT